MQLEQQVLVQCVDRIEAGEKSVHGECTVIGEIDVTARCQCKVDFPERSWNCCLQPLISGSCIRFSSLNLALQHLKRRLESVRVLHEAMDRAVVPNSLQLVSYLRPKPRRNGWPPYCQSKRLLLRLLGAFEAANKLSSAKKFAGERQLRNPARQRRRAG
jgi:hypothetical protein